jgi:diaminopimelate decarboxylase
MPASKDFQDRLYYRLPEIIRQFGTPFHLYDEKGIRETARALKKAFSDIDGFQEYFAVKALPNPHIMEIMFDEGFGFDCSSQMELELAQYVRAHGERIMFTSNNTTAMDFFRAKQLGAILNLDDISLIDKIPGKFPGLISFRYNPGKDRTGNSIIGNPFEAKYGITKDQLIPAYKTAQERGAQRFGIHTMVCSNERDYKYMVETINMLLAICLRIYKKLGIQCEFMNMGGGIGIPYKPEDEPFDIELLGLEARDLLIRFRNKNGFMPKLFMESGRYMTGPHGVLVTRVINRKDTYQTHIGVDAGMEALMRHAMYSAYHHITTLDMSGKVLSTEDRGQEVVNVVGAICENCDRLATQRTLPKLVEEDIVVTHDTGAHGLAMGFNYNGRLRPQELLLWGNGNVTRIRRAETTEDLWRTLRDIRQ